MQSFQLRRRVYLSDIAYFEHTVHDVAGSHIGRRSQLRWRGSQERTVFFAVFAEKNGTGVCDDGMRS